MSDEQVTKTAEEIAAEQAAAVATKTPEQIAAEQAAAEVAKTPEQKAAEAEAARVAKEAEEKKVVENHDVRRMKSFMRRAAEAEAKALALETVVKGMGQIQPQNQEPQRANFNSDIEYYQAVRAFDNRRFDERLQQGKVEAIQQAQRQFFAQKVAEAKKELPDYDEVIADTSAQFGPEVQEAIASSPIAGHLAYELAKDPDRW